MRQKQKERIFIFAVLGAIGLVISFLVSLQLENAKEQAFEEAYGRLVTDSRALTQSYQTEIGEWNSKQYNNGTMISITDQYLPKFQTLIDRAKELLSTGKYSKSRDLSIQSFQSELESYMHFRSFLVTGDKAEDAKSTHLLSDALRYETYAFAAFNSDH